MRYFDASALAKRYLREKGSVKVRRLLSSDVPATSRLSSVEIASALISRTREGSISDAQRERAMAALDADVAAMLVVELTPAIVAMAQSLLRRHALRAGDAIHLASCIHLQEELQDAATFIAFDDRLIAAAHLEGLKLV